MLTYTYITGQAFLLKEAFIGKTYLNCTTYIHYKYIKLTGLERKHKYLCGSSPRKINFIEYWTFISQVKDVNLKYLNGD